MVELELWWLLGLPLAFAIGWFARGYDASVRSAGEALVPRSVFRGLNLLLTEQPDKAIDAFVEVARLDSEMIELHYALGNLFRRRGEIDRAVRIHTHLLNRADLPAGERARALAQLGQDFLKGGLLDRAEDAFVRLLDDPAQRLDALRALLHIYQVERDWPRAIDCARRLEREAGEPREEEVAQFYCELAQAAILAQDHASAGRYLDEALTAHRRSVRAIVLAGDLALRRGARAEAVRHWLRLDTVAPEYLALVADRLAEAMDGEGQRAEALDLLRRRAADIGSIDLLDATVRRVAEWEGVAAAERLLAERLKLAPSLLGFERLLALRAQAGAGAADELDPLRQLIQSQARRLARYRCSKCGFRAREFHWHCPGCNAWDSYPPRRVEELDG